MEITLPISKIFHPSGATVELTTFGAHIISYKTSAGQPVLFLSSKATLDGSKAIRGGIPIAFPQFAAQGPLPMHGFARTSFWTLDAVGDGTAQLSLTDSDTTRAMWPHAFKLVLDISFDDHHMSTTLHVYNTGDSNPFSFEALLHTYLNLGHGNAESVTIRGLQGVTYLDKPSGGTSVLETADAITLRGEVDRIYINTPADVTVEGITTSLSGAVFKSLTVHRSAGLRQGSGVRLGVMPTPLDVVVWNPGAARAATIADLGEGEYRDYVCIEPGRVSAETANAHPGNRLLSPGQVWFIRQDINLHY